MFSTRRSGLVWGWMMSESNGLDLPELPEGYFWRITQGFGSEYMRIQIRQKLWLGSRLVVWTVVNRHRASYEKIQDLAGHVMTKFRVEERWRAFPGDYYTHKKESTDVDH